MELKAVTRWWLLDESQCLFWYSTVNKSHHSCYEWNTSHPISTQAIYSLHYPIQGPILIALSCIISYKFMHIKPILLVTTN